MLVGIDGELLLFPYTKTPRNRKILQVIALRNLEDVEDEMWKRKSPNI